MAAKYLKFGDVLTKHTTVELVWKISFPGVDSNYRILTNTNNNDFIQRMGDFPNSVVLLLT